MTARSEGLLAKIQSDGYCCLKGYLELCRARGQNSVDMGRFIGISEHTLWYHYRRLDAGKMTCKRFADCLQPVIKEIQDEKKAPE